METRTKDNLSSLITELKSHSPVQPTSWDNKLGAHNFFSKSELNIRYTEGKSESNTLPVAITLVKSFEENYEKTCNAINLLRRKSISTPAKEIKNASENEEKKSENGPAPLDLTFIHTPLSYGPRGKISKLASGDLLNHLENYIEKTVDIKEWIAQIILAVHELHMHGIVHRDIKLENILVFTQDDGSIKLKLADLDDVSLEMSAPKNISITPYYLPREICNEWSKFSDDNEIISTKYIAANKKAIDCYCIGAMIHCAITEWHLIPLQPGIEKLINQLTEVNPKLRLTAEQALQHPYFGKTDEERLEYFNSIKQKFALKEMYIDGYYLDKNNLIPDINDHFFIFPENLKSICLTAIDLNMQLNFIKKPHNSKHQYFESINEYHFDESTLLAIQKKAARLQEEIALYKDSIEASNITDRINTIANNISQVIATLLSRRISAITNERLIFSVKTSIEQFCRINKITSASRNQLIMNLERLFVNHGAYEKHNAEILLKTLEEKQETTSPRKMFGIIQSYLENGPGNTTHHSFKSLLTIELQTISAQPFDLWKDKLDDTEAEVEQKYTSKTSSWTEFYKVLT